VSDGGVPALQDIEVIISQISAQSIMAPLVIGFEIGTVDV